MAVQAKNDYRIDEILNGDKFIHKCFIEPTNVLSNYGFLLIQVNIILQLLSWDPSLEYLRDQVLKGKTLYLDSNILFSLMLKNDHSHELINSLITASSKELGVNVKVHEITLDEYEAVIREINKEFQEIHRQLRDIVKITRGDDYEILQILGNGIFTDYLMIHKQHVDLGSWQRYMNGINRDAVIDKIEKMDIKIDLQKAYVPNKTFYKIKENLRMGSIDQVKRGKREYKKIDVTHDAQIYHLITENRTRKSDEFAFGFDTYLLTFDGSLSYFAKYQGISWLDTYFIYPNQWYEIAFPFLRMKISHNPNIARTLSSMAFSSVFHTLESLIPLEVLGYIFDHGGSDLSIGSIRSLIEACTEGRVMQRLDPANKNLRERERAELRLERMIAESLIEEKKIVESLTKETKQLERKKESLYKKITQQEEQIGQLDQKTFMKEAEVLNLDKQLQTKEHITDIYSSAEELRKKIKDNHISEIEEIKSIHNEEITTLSDTSRQIIDEQKSIAQKQELYKIDALEGLSLIKDNLDNNATFLVKLSLWICFAIYLMILLILGYLCYRIGWDTMEPWTYFIGVFITIVGPLYFIITQKEISPTLIFEQMVEKQKKNKYLRSGFNLDQYNRLKTKK